MGYFLSRGFTKTLLVRPAKVAGRIDQDGTPRVGPVHKRVFSDPARALVAERVGHRHPAEP